MRGDPGERRRFLDDLLVSRHPRYAASAPTTTGCCGSARALLKTARAAAAGDLRTLDVWDGHLARHGAALLAGAAGAGRGARAAAPSRRSPRSRPTLGADRAAATGQAWSGELPADAGGAGGAAARRAGAGAPAGGGARRVPGRPAPRRPRAAARRRPGQGLRQPRRVLVARAGAAARRPTGCCCADDVEPVLVLDDVFAELDAQPPASAGRGRRARRAGADHRRGRGGRAGRARRRPVRGERRGVSRRGSRRTSDVSASERDLAQAGDKPVDTVDNSATTGDDEHKRPPVALEDRRRDPIRAGCPQPWG